MRSASGRLRSALTFALLLATAPGTTQESAPRRVGLGVVTDGPAVRDRLHADVYRREILALLEGEFAVQEILLEADWTVAGVEQLMQQLLADPEVDVVLAGGVTASAAALRLGDPPKPVIAPYVLDAELQGAPFDRGSSGVRNLVYVTYPPVLGENLDRLQELVDFDRLVVLRPPIPAPAAQVLEERVQELASGRGIDARVLEAAASAEETLARLGPDAGAVYVLPLLHMEREELRRLAEGFVARRLPSFAATPEDVELGMLASTTRPGEVGRLARRVAIDLQRILLGEEAGSLPVLFERGVEMTVNVATARAIDVHPSFALEADARLIGEPSQAVARRLELAVAVDEAVAANVDLRAAARGVDAARQQLRSSRAGLLPQLELSALGVAIDADRGSALQAQRTLEAGLGLRQALYSDRAWADLEVRRRQLDSEQQQLEALRLDVTRDAATAYLTVLQARTVERITRQNLELTRQNLDRARARVQIGVANRSEVHRWEAQLATGRADLIEATASRNVAEMEVNRIRDRPLEEAFVTEEVGLDDESLVTSDERIVRYLRNRHVFRIFRAFNVLEALANSPELKQLDAQVAIQERLLLGAERAFFLPEVGLEARVDKRLHEGGVGADAPGGDWDWQIGVQASIPLFTSGSRSAARARAEADLDRLRTQRRAVSQRVEQRVRAAMHLAGSSHAGIDLARQAAAAARQSLDLVSDAYARGAVSIIELLDAQTSSFVAELSAANALHRFLIDLVEAERAVGRFDFFASAGDRDAYLERLRAFAARAEAAQEEEP